MDMDLRYEFRVKPPEERMSIRIDTFDAEGLILTALHLARRSELTDSTLIKAFFSIPFLTSRVFGGIHWEALKIRLKGVRLQVHPAPPEHSVSVVHTAAESKEAPVHEPA